VRKVGGRGVVLALVSAIASFAVPVAAAAATKPPLVRGGAVPPAGDWGWTVALAFHGEPNAVDAQFCTGTLVAPTIVITAAHCLVNDKTGKPMAAARVDVITGRTDLKAEGGQRIPAADLRMHPRAQKDPSADVGVVVLSEPRPRPSRGWPTTRSAVCGARAGRRSSAAGA
jgi:secreted trypsin-like serine protease